MHNFTLNDNRNSFKNFTSLLPPHKIDKYLPKLPSRYININVFLCVEFDIFTDIPDKILGGAHAMYKLRLSDCRFPDVSVKIANYTCYNLTHVFDKQIL